MELQREDVKTQSYDKELTKVQSFTFFFLKRFSLINIEASLLEV